MTAPNFFIVGAAKCGTTALATYLGSHPNIFMCNPKEPHYFADDLPGYQFVKTPQAYEKLFSRAEGKLAVGEASVYYLLSAAAARRIHAFNPDAKLIVMLRNPTEMVYSLHGQLLYSCNEDEPDFLTAWNLQRQRAEGLSIPKDCMDQKVLQYRRVASYADQLRRLFEFFPREQVKVILFDDFKHDSRQVYEDVLAYLAVPADSRADFSVVNASHAHKSRWVGQVLRRKPPLVRKAWSAVKRTTGLDERAGQAVGDWLRQRNTAYRPRPALPNQIRSMLVNAFAGDVVELEQIIGRDLRRWRTVE